MKNVTVNDWSDYLSDIRTYQTEYIYGDHSVMYSKLSLEVTRRERRRTDKRRHGDYCRERSR